MTFVRMFQPRFHQAVETGEKLQTIRPAPKRMPKEGDTISCRAWVGKPYRSKQRVLCEGIIESVAGVVIDDCSVAMNAPDFACTFFECPWFAKQDGFKDWPDMRAWFESAHGLPFTGILIAWKQTWVPPWVSNSSLSRSVSA